MEILVAREIGYCYGVRDAVDLAIDESERAGGQGVVTLGPVIHNPRTIEMLEGQHNVRAVETPAQVPERTHTVVIRTHGTTPDRMSELRARALRVVDATCPFVLKTHRKARDLAAEGYFVVILGKKSHPEVVGIAGQVPGRCAIVQTREDLAAIPWKARIGVVYQSTVTVEEFAWALPLLAERTGDLNVLRTICGVTITRQQRVEEVAREVDLMIIIGGRASSNTKALVHMVQARCRTVHIEEPAEADGIDLAGVRRVGIGTGTSTPDFLVDEVVERLEARAAAPV